MSRPIKLTQELIDECRQDFEKALSLTKLSDGKLSFTKAFSCGDRKAVDYRSALRNEDEGLLKSLELFFHSEWYRILTDVDADRLLGMLRRERSGSLQAAYI